MASQQRAATPLGAGPPCTFGDGAAPPRSSVLLSKGGTCPSTAAGQGAAGAAAARPMTSSKGAGYSSTLVRAGSSDIQPSTGSTGVAAAAGRDQSEALEERVHQLLEEAAARVAAGDPSGGVDVARDAVLREQRLCTLLEQAGLGDQISLDLKFAVSLGLAAAYEANQQLTDALAVYNQVLRSRLFPQAGWLRLNMGAIHFRQQDYAQAVKQFRMALDTTPPAYRRLRLNTMRNIGLAFVRSGRYQEATNTFGAIMQDGADHQTAFNLVLCAAAARDADLMRQSFVELLQVPPYADDTLGEEGSEEEGLPGSAAGEPDALHVQLQTKQAEAESFILAAARLIAPLLHAGSWSAGFDWCREQLNAASYGALASEVQLARANEHLARKEYAAAVALLKEFGRSDSRQRAAAAVNLSTLALLEGQLESASGYGDYCCEADPSNPAALVSRGNVHMAQGQAEAALQLYEDALQLDDGCLQALFNAGLACRALGLPERALALIHQLLHASPGHAEAMWQAAELCDELGNTARAMDWLTRLLTKTPHDSGVLSRLGALHAKLDDEGEALAYHTEAFAADRANLDTVSWLGAHHVRRQDYLAAVPYFEAAARVQPRESKWPLMVAGCLRRVGRLEAALLQYREVYRMAPTNTEALRYLSQLSQEFGLQEDVHKFSSELARIERRQAAAADAPSVAGTTLRSGTALGRLTAQRPTTTGGHATALSGLTLPAAARAGAG